MASAQNTQTTQTGQTGQATQTNNPASSGGNPQGSTDTTSPESSGRYYKFRCKYFLTHNCTNWVYVNGAPCPMCCAEGRE
ncbi:hypothetical protein ABKA04_007928 [Annulohypoxylon sp. FPYF3050]